MADSEKPTSTTPSAFACASNHTLRHRDGLIRYCEDGRYSIDNNHTEREIKPFVSLKKNFMFSASQEGARALCVHFSLIRSDKLHKLDPYRYYVEVMKKVPYCETVEDHEVLLPWNVNLEKIVTQDYALVLYPPKGKQISSFSGRGHSAYCRLTGIYNSHIGKRKAYRKINKWKSQVEINDLDCFNRFIKTLKKHQKEIEAMFKGRDPSGVVEGFNNKVKVLTRRCYGIFNENSLFRRLFVDCQGYSLFIKNRGVLTI